MVVVLFVCLCVCLCVCVVHVTIKISTVLLGEEQEPSVSELWSSRDSEIRKIKNTYVSSE